MPTHTEKDRTSGKNGFNATRGGNTQTPVQPKKNLLQIALDKGKRKKENVSSAILHDEILEVVLKGVKPLNYLDFANGLSTENFDKLTQDQYALFCALKALEYIRENGADIRVINYKKATLYNGKFWKTIDELDDIADFLKRFAEKTKGIPPQMLAKVRFLEALPKQFLMNCGKIPRAKNTDTVKINLNNGTLHINKKGVAKLLPHNPNDYLQYCIDYDYDPKAKCPNFDKFLDEVLPDTTQQQLYFDYVGACFHIKLKLEKIVMLLGLNGANGKSTLLDITAGTLGENNISSLTPDQLLKDDPNFFLPQAEGKLLNIASEMGKKINSDKLKRYASGEPITAENKGEKAYAIYNYPRLIISVNNLPRINDTGNAVYRRLEILKFDNEIHPDDRDPDLKDNILKDEKAGILNKILKGVKNIAKNRKLPKCNISQAIVNQYKMDGDNVLEFLKEKGYKNSDSQWLKLDEIYSPYKNFCEAAGYNSCGRSNFRLRLEKAGYKGKRGVRFYNPDGILKRRFHGWSFLIEIDE